MNGVLLHYVRLELADTPSLGTLFRGNSVASRIISAYVSVVASTSVLKSSLTNVLGELVMADSERLIDKESAMLQQQQQQQSQQQQQQQSQQQEDEEASSQEHQEEEEDEEFEFIGVYAEKILSAILKSVDQLPSAVRVCCRLVANVVAERFEEDQVLARRLAVGNVLFLRFFVPAIMSPIEHHLLPVGSVTSSILGHLRHITAAIQCVANQTSFNAAKTASALNPFIENQREAVNSYLEQVCQEGDDSNVAASATISKESYENSLFSVVLAKYICS